MQVVKLMPFKISSYLSYLLPLALAAYFNQRGFAAIILFTVGVGFWYHWSGEREEYVVLDGFAALLLAFADAALLFLANFSEPYLVLALALLLVGIFYYIVAQKRHYSWNHGMWHVCGALITLLCVLAYAL